MERRQARPGQAGSSPVASRRQDDATEEAREGNPGKLQMASPRDAMPWLGEIGGEQPRAVSREVAAPAGLGLRRGEQPPRPFCLLPCNGTVLRCNADRWCKCPQPGAQVLR